jgi:hypothetical protein
MRILFFLSLISLAGCFFKSPHYKKEPKESHILKTDKQQIKESIKHQKEHAKAAERKRKELDEISHKGRSDNAIKKKKTKKAK